MGQVVSCLHSSADKKKSLHSSDSMCSDGVD